MENESEQRLVNGFELMLLFNAGLSRMPKCESLFGTSRQAAEQLNVSMRRLNQLVLDEGLPRVSRDRFYLPDVCNWQMVSLIAKAMHRRAKDMADYGFVDFTLAKDEGPIFLKPEAMKKLFTPKNGKRHGKVQRPVEDNDRSASH